MSTSAAPFRIVFQRSDGQRFYFDREVEARDKNNVACTQPHFGDDARLARKFQTPIEAISRRDAFRKLWNCERFFIESCSGDSEALFEDRAAEVQPTFSEDNRTALFVSPDGYEGSGLGVIAQPAYTAALGRCWAVRSCDIPSLNEESPSALETIYDPDPVAAVEKARALWRIQPYPLPALEAKADETLKRIQHEMQNPRLPGRLRPGSR